MKIKSLLFVALFLLSISIVSCEKDRNMKLIVNGDTLNYEVKATAMHDDSDKIHLKISKRSFDQMDDINIEILNIEPMVAHPALATNIFSTDSLTIRTRRSFPEFGNQERTALLWPDDRYDNYFEMVSFHDKIGHCKLKYRAVLSMDERDFEGYDPAIYEFDIEAEFEFRIF